MRSCSNCYRRDCYILKLDIKGYFMSINRYLLFEKIKEIMLSHQSNIVFNLEMVLYLIEQTIFNNPTQNCIVKGKKSDWYGLPDTKSLFHAQPDCGLPIGNLTSQLFGNIYLNEFDHFVKKQLKIKYYGRYVDDFILLHPDKEYLKLCIHYIRAYLKEKLELELHPDKIHLQHFTKGVKYLGTVLKPYRIYIASRTKGNFYKAIEDQNKIAIDHKPTKQERKAFLSSMNSYLGIMKHYKTYKLRKKMINKYLSAYWCNLVRPVKYLKFEPKQKIIKKSGIIY